jgi:hypothetical protein
MFAAGCWLAVVGHEQSIDERTRTSLEGWEQPIVCKMLMTKARPKADE